MSDQTVRVRLLFVDDGGFHHEEIDIPAAAPDRYDRLLDCLLEDPAVLARLHLDPDRLCAAYLTAEDDRG